MVKRPLILLVAGFSMGGCAGPSGTKAERRDADAAGAIYQAPLSERELPALRETPTTDDLLRHAFLANPSLEAEYHRWRQSLERIVPASSWEQPELGFKYLTSSGMMRAWDRTTLEAFQAIPLAGKRGLQADAALAEALASRRRFEQVKFELQRQVLSAAADYRYLGRGIEAAEAEVRLLDALVSTTAGRQRSGTAPGRDALAVRNLREEAENGLRMLQARRGAQAAALNGLLGRDPTLPLSWPAEDPLASIPADDGTLFRLAAERNPELMALAAEIRGRKDALAYAKRLWVPDLKLGYEAMGDLEASLTGMLTLPLRTGRIRAAVRESRSGLDEARAKSVAGELDLRARLVAALAMARDADRQSGLYRETILPRLERIVASLHSGYRDGIVGYADLNEGERALLEVRLARFRALADREQALAELESILAMDRVTWAQTQPKPEEASHER